MTKGSCDPSPDPFNETTLSKGDGTVTVDVQWGWDGASVYPECDGPVFQVHYTNTGVVTWIANLPKKTRGTTSVTINPGDDITVSGNQLKQAGLDTYSTIRGLTLTTTP